jgi:NADPH:quinone reductase-like Zn-dependent oxidoreductase
VGDEVFGRGQNAQAEYAVLNAWALKPSSVDWAVAAAAGVAGETSERALRLLGVKSGGTMFIDGGAGGVGAVAVQMAVARGARVIAPRAKPTIAIYGRSGRSRCFTERGWAVASGPLPAG